MLFFMNYESQKQDVFIFGATGKVGKTLVKQILRDDQKERRLVGVASSAEWLYNQKGLYPQTITYFYLKKKKTGGRNIANMRRF